MLQCECLVALCVPCALKKLCDVLMETRGDYHKAAVACPKCDTMPICFTTIGATIGVGYNVDARSVVEIDRQVRILEDQALEERRSERRSVRGKDHRATYYANALQHYRTTFRLLCDVPEPKDDDSPDFYRLLLARAEKYRQEDVTPGRVVEVLLDDLPLGPLGALRFVENKVLDAYLHGRPVSNVCSTCKDDIAPGNTAFSMCMCTEVSTIDFSPILRSRIYLNNSFLSPVPTSGSAGLARCDRWGRRAQVPRPTRTSKTTMRRCATCWHYVYMHLPYVANHILP